MISKDADTARDLRARVARLKHEVTAATQAYRHAAASHDAQGAILLLRSRSLLMKQLLESQCELLLAMRSSASGAPDVDSIDPIPERI